MTGWIKHILIILVKLFQYLQQQTLWWWLHTLPYIMYSFRVLSYLTGHTLDNEFRRATLPLLV